MINLIYLCDLEFSEFWRMSIKDLKSLKRNIDVDQWPDKATLLWAPTYSIQSGWWKDLPKGLEQIQRGKREVRTTSKEKAIYSIDEWEANQNNILNEIIR